MKIVHIVLGKANPDRMNGVNKVVHELATHQKIAGHDVSVWGITANLKHDYPSRNFNTFLFPSAASFRISNELKKAIAEADKSTVFHLHGGFVPAMYAAAKKLRAHGLKYVFTPHGSYNVVAMQRSALRKNLYYRLFEKSLIAGAHGIHCIGKSELEATRKLTGHPRVILVPYGFTLPDLPSTPLKMSEKGFTYAFCGRLDMHTKGLDIMLDAIAEYRLDVPIQLWIIGDGGERKDLEQKVMEKKMEHAVVFWGSRFGHEKNTLIHQADVFVHPSRNEGLPSAVIEANALGVPCIVTEATNTGDFIRKHACGEVAEEPTKSDLIKAMQRMTIRLRKMDIEQLRRSCRTMVEEEFNWNRIVKLIDEIYN